MKDEVTNLYLNIAPRLPRLIQDQPLERGGNAHPDPWPGAICAPGAIRIISGEGRVYQSVCAGESLRQRNAIRRLRRWI
jgi:hypothetical protein